MTGCHRNGDLHGLLICSGLADHIKIHHANITFHHDLFVFRNVRNQRTESEHAPIHHQFSHLDHRGQIRIKEVMQTNKIVQKVHHVLLKQNQLPDFFAVGEVRTYCHIVLDQFVKDRINILFRVTPQLIAVKRIKNIGIFPGGPTAIGGKFCFQSVPGIHIQFRNRRAFGGIQRVKEGIDFFPPERVQRIGSAHQFRSFCRVGNGRFFQKVTDRFRCERVVCQSIAGAAGNIPEPECGCTAEEGIGLIRNGGHGIEESAGLFAVRQHLFRCGIIFTDPDKVICRQFFKLCQQFLIDPIRAGEVFFTAGKFHDAPDAVSCEGIIFLHRFRRDHTITVLKGGRDQFFMIADLAERDFLRIRTAQICQRHLDRVIHGLAFCRIKIQVGEADRIAFPVEAAKIFQAGKDPIQRCFYFIAADPVVLIRIHGGEKIFIADEGIGLGSGHCPMRHIHVCDHAQVFAFGDQHLSGTADQTERHTLFFCFAHINSLSVFRRIAPHLILSETPHSAPEAAHRSPSPPTGSAAHPARWSVQADAPMLRTLPC